LHLPLVSFTTRQSLHSPSEDISFYQPVVSHLVWRIATRLPLKLYGSPCTGQDDIENSS